MIEVNANAKSIHGTDIGIGVIKSNANPQECVVKNAVSDLSWQGKQRQVAAGLALGNTLASARLSVGVGTGDCASFSVDEWQQLLIPFRESWQFLQCWW
jgi:hypothetical protein